jgi:hypothetical protein
MIPRTRSMVLVLDYRIEFEKERPEGFSNLRDVFKYAQTYAQQVRKDFEKFIRAYTTGKLGRCECIINLSINHSKKSFKARPCRKRLRLDAKHNLAIQERI